MTRGTLLGLLGNGQCLLICDVALWRSLKQLDVFLIAVLFLEAIETKLLLFYNNSLTK